MQDKCKDISLDKGFNNRRSVYHYTVCFPVLFSHTCRTVAGQDEKIRLAGYNCIDVYFPWNFHELDKVSGVFSDRGC